MLTVLADFPSNFQTKSVNNFAKAQQAVSGSFIQNSDEQVENNFQNLC